MRRWLLFTIETIVAANAVGGAIWGLGGAKDVLVAALGWQLRPEAERG